MELLLKYVRILLKPDSVKKKSVKSILENTANFGILVILIPAVYLYEICIVLPLVAEKWTTTYFIHIIWGTFLTQNIIANMLYGTYTNTSIKGKYMPKTAPNKNWTSCAICECWRPPRAWHCDDCNVCILKRDHHCTFWACCIGYSNRRYFALFTFHIFASMTYTSYYNIAFLAQFLTWNFGIIVKFACPIICLLRNPDIETIYVFIIILNALVAILTGSLFFYHFYNIVNGKIVPDSKHYTNDVYDKGWKLNLIEVFGSKWYLTWISPFINSPLPENGTEWNDDKYE